MTDSGKEETASEALRSLAFSQAVDLDGLGFRVWGLGLRV